MALLAKILLVIILVVGIAYIFDEDHDRDPLE